MRKSVLLLVAFILSMHLHSTAYAGTINSYEQDILTAAQEVYIYNGVAYKLDSFYLDELRNYLLADDVDLTEVQRDKVLRLAFDNIETGVLGGYLKPVNDLPASIAPENEEPDSHGDATDANASTSESTGSVNTENILSMQTDSHNKPDKNITEDENIDIPDDAITDSFLKDVLDMVLDDEKSVVASSDDKLSEKAVQKQVTTPVKDTAVAKITDMHTNTVITGNTVHNLKITYVVLSILGLLMLGGIIITIRISKIEKYDKSKN